MPPGPNVTTSSYDTVPATAIPVVVAASYPVVRSYLRDVLGASDGIEVAAVGADTDEVLAATETHEPDVVLLGLALPAPEHAVLTRAIRKLRPSAAVLLLRDSAAAAEVLAALDAGAAGYLLKDLDPSELVPAVRAAATGDTPMSPGASTALLELGPRQRDQLTPRGRDVLRLLAQGLTNKGIARRLGIAEKTVKSHLSVVFERIGVTDRVQAAVWAATRGSWLSE